MWENDVGTGLIKLQEGLRCRGCYFALEHARKYGNPCCTKREEKTTGLGGVCLDRKPVRV